MREILATVAIMLMAQAQDLPVEQTKKNIKVLQGVPSSQLIPVMAFISNSLGVTCAHCHAKEWDSDEKPPKNVARKMIAMQRAINDQHFGGTLTVTCNSCHRGYIRPTSTPDVADAGWNVHASLDVPKSVSGADAVSRLHKPPDGVTRRVVRGVIERYSGRDEPKSAPFTLTVEGEDTKYETELSHPPEATRALLAYVLQPPPVERLRPERWIFSDGDLVRRNRETPTPLGNLPEQVDYSDYRVTETGRVPFRAIWSRADYRVTYTVESVSK